MCVAGAPVAVEDEERADDEESAAAESDNWAELCWADEKYNVRHTHAEKTQGNSDFKELEKGHFLEH